ncbi:MAG: hypothetical protein LBQ83_04485 [Candidatus Margulisbacteria bacterium]|jgi:hypothetical protein|nr:hypothetical protein [Candidatus Margulisiibacteriota bacterium]
MPQKARLADEFSANDGGFALAKIVPSLKNLVTPSMLKLHSCLLHQNL